MPTFRLRADHPEVSVSQPSWRGGLVVVPGGTVTDLGELVTSAKGQPDDAYLVRGGDGTEKAWPKALWELDKPAEKTGGDTADKAAAAAPKGK